MYFLTGYQKLCVLGWTVYLNILFSRYRTKQTISGNHIRPSQGFFPECGTSLLWKITHFPGALNVPFLSRSSAVTFTRREFTTVNMNIDHWLSFLQGDSRILIVFYSASQGAYITLKMYIIILIREKKTEKNREKQ